jgi:hypothetical protein
MAVVVASLVLSGLAALWTGRLAVTAPPEQQREADEHA